MKKRIAACLLWGWMATASAADLSLDLQNVNLPDAIRILSKFMGRNVVVSAAVTGTVSLQLQHATATDVFDLLLSSQGLMESRKGNVHYIAPRGEVANRQQEEWKFHELQEDTAHLVTRLWQIRYAKADDIAQVLQDGTTSLLSRRGHVRVDTRTNQLCVQEIEPRLAMIGELIRSLDVPVQQVQIEARLASVDDDVERELGISFTAESPHATVNALTEPTHHARFSLAVAKLADGSQLDIALAAMETAGKGELISSPSLFTANQQPAAIESGEEIPYQEVSASGGTSVAFKKAVLSLKVTPQIMPGNQVLLRLQINQDRPSNRLVLGVPAITTRQVSTSILVKNGQTLVLGGIYELNQEHSEQRIPFLGKIPLVGLLFQQHNARESRRELLIFVTPKIIS